MNKMYTRTILREIKQSFGRFAAIIAIVALGVGFLMGLLSSTPDMKASADRYYEESAMSDFNIKSTMGLTKGDLSALKAMPETHQIMPAYVTDALMTTGDGELLTGRLYGMDLSNMIVNKLTLKQGRMPDSAKECVIEPPNSYMSQLSIGDTLALSPDNSDLEDTYAQREFTIVGIVDSPYYFCNSKEPASVGNGRAGAIAYTLSEAYCLDTYTDLFLTAKKEDSSFSEEYEEQMEAVSHKIEHLSGPRIKIRHEEVLAEAQKKIDKARKKLEKERTKALREFSDAEAELSDGQSKIEQGEADLKRGEQELEDGKKQLKDGRKQLADGKKQLENGRTQLENSKKELDAAKDSVEQAKAAQEAGIPLSPEVLAQIEAYDKGLAQWEKGSAQLSRQENRLLQAEQKLRDSKEQIRTGRQELKKGRADLATARAELAKGRRKYEKARAEANAEFAKAEAKIRKNEKKLKDIEEPEWYILDRNSNLSYARYKVDAEKVAAVATVFPIFFFLVAALVSLTTMTRMVEEERIQIGTLKALGYRRSTIMSKYLLYCGTATVLGCILGLISGYSLLPAAVFKAYESQYALPELILQFHYPYAALSCGLEVLCTLGATWLACSHTLKERPASLMILRAPKAGKRIFLERLGFLWKRLSFTYKATARNIFRYKKHLFMTVIGIAGCTALMVAGFGMRDSMSIIVEKQYTDILKYDMRIELSEDKSDSILKEFLLEKKSVKIRSEIGDVSNIRGSSREIVSATLYVPQDSLLLPQFIRLQGRTDQKKIVFGKNSAVMTEKMADLLELNVGDSFTFTNADDKPAEFTLTGITENYAGCSLYMEKSLYENAFGKPEYNGWLLDSGITSLALQDETAEHLQKSEYVSAVEFTSQSRESYDAMLSSINIIVYMLIFCAGALAIVVLYNLTNININERTRELATLRVLGYHHGEVAHYIFREIGLLSILGTLAGLIAGKILHYYIIVIAETADMMMGRNISPTSYLLAAVLTLAFSAVVDVLMTFKLRRIEMVESMKAVD